MDEPCRTFRGRVWLPLFTHQGPFAMRGTINAILKRMLPATFYNALRAARDFEGLSASIDFLFGPHALLGYRERIGMLARLYYISVCVESLHTQKEMLTFIKAILAIPKDVPGVIIEAGCYKGSSTAKFSLAAKLAGRELVVFDSFQGLPDSPEGHSTTIYGFPVHFRQGDFHGGLEEVKNNVRKYGDITCCRFVKGWFEETLPHFTEPVAAVYLDVDLVSSTQTCLKHLYPLLIPGGALYSQDGHLPLVVETIEDPHFWKKEVGLSAPPRWEGVRKEKLIKVIKEPSHLLSA